MQPAPSSRLRKLAVTFIAAFAILNLLFLFTEALPQAWLEKLGDNAFSILLAAQLGLTLLIAAVYAFRWHRREQADPSVSGPRYAWLHAIIRYWLAFEIATYGWAKILRTQFQGNYMTEDMTLANSSGFSLTWYYFGYSYILACIIGAVQITGSAMLLFRRTTLLGTILLLPVMLNIVLINLFYDIAAGAFLNSVAFTTGLCYLLSLHWTELRKTILYWKDQLPAVGKTWMRWSARLLMLAGPAAFIGSFVLFGDTTESKLVGKWKVNRMVRNGDTLSATAWVTDSLSYSKLYFEQYGTCAFSSNPYAFQWDQARRGRYSFREKEGRLTAELKGRGPNKDSLHASIQFFNADSMMLHGAYKGDTIMLWMTREKSKR